MSRRNPDADLRARERSALRSGDPLAVGRFLQEAVRRGDEELVREVQRLARITMADVGAELRLAEQKRADRRARGLQRELARWHALATSADEAVYRFGNYPPIESPVLAGRLDVAAHMAREDAAAQRAAESVVRIRGASRHPFGGRPATVRRAHATQRWSVVNGRGEWGASDFETAREALAYAKLVDFVGSGGTEILKLSCPQCSGGLVPYPQYGVAKCACGVEQALGNPGDEDLRDLERRAQHDPRARRQLRRERLRRGLPDPAFSGARKLARRARRVAPHRASDEWELWVREPDARRSGDGGIFGVPYRAATILLPPDTPESAVVFAALADAGFEFEDADIYHASPDRWEFLDAGGDVMAALQRTRTGVDYRRPNPDEDLRDLERRAQHDPRARRQLRLERLRRGLPDKTWTGARKLSRRARALARAQDEWEVWVVPQAGTYDRDTTVRGVPVREGSVRLPVGALDPPEQIFWALEDQASMVFDDATLYHAAPDRWEVLNDAGDIVAVLQLVRNQRPNPDEDLRDLERRAMSDPASAVRLRRELLRRGEPLTPHLPALQAEFSRPELLLLCALRFWGGLPWEGMPSSQLARSVRNVARRQGPTTPELNRATKALLGKGYVETGGARTGAWIRLTEAGLEASLACEQVALPPWNWRRTFPQVRIDVRDWAQVKAAAVQLARHAAGLSGDLFGPGQGQQPAGGYGINEREQQLDRIRTLRDAWARTLPQISFSRVFGARLVSSDHGEEGTLDRQRSHFLYDLWHGVTPEEAQATQLDPYGFN